MWRRGGGSMATWPSAKQFLQQNESFGCLGLVKILQEAETFSRRERMSPMHRRTAWVLSVCVLALSLGGCGGDGGTSRPTTPDPIVSTPAPPPPPPPPPAPPPPP